MFADEKYQTFSQRFWAGLIDGVILLPISMATGAILSSPHAKLPLIATGAISYLSYPVYSICMHAMFGKTIGKMLRNITVLDVSEKRLPTFWQAARRDIAPLLCELFSLGNFVRFVILFGYVKDMHIHAGWLGILVGWVALAWYVLELATMLFNEKRRALHDLIAGTVVVTDGSYLLPLERKASISAPKPMRPSP